ncbi:MAG: PKD domain-containing protein, partial [Flavobacteriaceae bacterium]|nr:PKD domain-containing protein [Flavobacteriaceae bacterium]
MRNLYKIVFLFVLVNVNSTFAFSINTEKDKSESKTVASPSAQIIGNNTVCLNATAPLVKFEVIDDNGKDPYTFTYTINGGAPLTVTTQGSNKSITVHALTNVTGTFIYILTGVKDNDNNTVAVSSNDKVTINVNPLPVVDFTFTDNQCSGNSIQFTSNVSGNSPFTYLWSFGGSGNTSTNQNPTYIFNNSNGNSSQSFNVTLNVTDANGCINKITKVITIQNP